MPLKIFSGTVAEKDLQTRIGDHVIWKIGEPYPPSKLAFAPLVVIEADGQEYLWLSQRLIGVPTVLGGLRRPIRWTGDHARFIILNLESLV